VCKRGGDRLDLLRGIKVDGDTDRVPKRVRVRICASNVVRGHDGGGIRCGSEGAIG
jgi:hypothetical protein